MEVCRSLVLEAITNETVVSCQMAHWLCLVDPVCSAALGYYEEYCKRVLLQGSTCTERCWNSAEILRRQERATKLNHCRCNGKVECLRNKERMVRLCYGGETGGGNKSGGGGGRKNRKKHRPKMFDQDPDRAVVEMMLANPDYQPDGWDDGAPTLGVKGSAARVRPGHVFATVVAVAAVTLVTGSLLCSPSG